MFIIQMCNKFISIYSHFLYVVIKFGMCNTECLQQT